MLTVGDVLEWIDDFAPFEYAEEWDRVGLQVGRIDAGVSGILVALDVSPEVIEEAHNLGCECIVSHHPLIFNPAEAIREDIYPTSLVCELIRRGISLIVAHTNLDCSSEGTNAAMAERLGLSNIFPLKTCRENAKAAEYWGAGVIGTVRPINLGDLVVRVSELFGNVPIVWAGDAQMVVSRVGVCAGSGGSLIDDFIGLGADCFITGEAKYHDVHKAIYGGMGVIMLGHDVSEMIVLDRVAANLRRRAQLKVPDLKIFVSAKEVRPVKFYLPRR